MLSLSPRGAQKEWVRRASVQDPKGSVGCIKNIWAA
uniref:Uncharacterized protein n=1 Tax=Anguilla anguilla TaxID=7936 RepID=A0A0E9WB58_ANGAN